MVFTKSDNQYNFGDGAQVTAVSGAMIPITIGTTKTKMHVDIVPSNISKMTPLQLLHNLSIL